ncbi:ArnT family glycosyltransferase [Dyella jiangningensis]|uniref:4-amino-4-deoxy-L-arabinose transferase n=1 Tax=Dyella jiangningensis TaxID=1379159 RepID=A0A328NY35_9GAMM|nr:glycosyltransferase family 39 protein [Dyella jiangningensis]RAO75087.1 4-amino-4-deoxy-L-arabinose transferase [Dyella jiangningensis]
MRDVGSVAVGVARWRAVFLAGFVTLFLLKLMLAATLSPFGDEAFYWQESRHLAWGYSDLPPLTAWLIRLGEIVCGHGLLGLRWPFLLIGSALPWLVRALARGQFDEKTGWQAGALCLVLPLAGSLGVMAVPDVPLTVAITVALWALLRAMQRDRLRGWCWLGFALGVCWLAHYRAAMPMLAGLLLLSITPRGRQQWRRTGLWLAMGVAALGLVPLVISNWQQGGAGVAFQVAERNPWRFHADALVQPVEQAIACTPLLYALLLWTAWRCWKRRHEGAPWDVVGIVSASFIVLYFALGLFADDLRFRAHWPLPGYLPLLAVLPVLLREHAPCRRGWIAAALGLALAGQLSGLAYLGLAATGERGASVLAHLKVFPARFVGWTESGAAARQLLARHPAVLVADNFMLAAEIDFQLGGHVPVYVLDSPLNLKHGRAPQLAIWQRDETALRRLHGGAPMLLVLDEKALRVHERADWLRTLCGRIEEPESLLRLDLYEGRRRVAFYAGRVPSGVPGDAVMDDRCPLWQFARTADAAK